MKSTKFLFLMLVIIALITSGCWSYKEIEKLAIVAGMAIDKDAANNKYILTVELVNQTSGEKESKTTSEIIETEGDTVFSAARDMILESGRKLYWSHAKVIIISQAIAREGILPVLDWVGRNHEMRPDMWLLISREKTAGEILKTHVDSNEVLAYHLNELLIAKNNVGKYGAVDLLDCLMDLSSDKASTALPAVNVIVDREKKIPQIIGTAVFKKDKLVGWLNGDETQALLLLASKPFDGILTLQENQFNDNTPIAVQIYKNKTKITPVFENGKLVMQIRLMPDVAIGEVGSAVDYTNEANLKILQTAAEDKLKIQSKATTIKLQKDYKTDILGFGCIIKREMPDLWRKISPEWDQIYSNMEVQLSADVHIRNTGTVSKPNKIGG